jgi:hypothetical protein
MRLVSKGTYTVEFTYEELAVLTAVLGNKSYSDYQEYVSPVFYQKGNLTAQQYHDLYGNLERLLASDRPK